MIEDKEHRNVENRPSHDSEKERPLPSAKTLKSVNREKAHEHERRREASDPQEISAKAHSLRIRDKQAYNAACQNFVHRDAERPDDQSGDQ